MDFEQVEKFMNENFSPETTDDEALFFFSSLPIPRQRKQDNTFERLRTFEN